MCILTTRNAAAVTCASTTSPIRCSARAKSAGDRNAYLERNNKELTPVCAQVCMCVRTVSPELG